MDARERKAILSQGAIRPETPRDRRHRRRLEEDLRGSPVLGKPLELRLRNFPPDPARQVASLGGPAAWMRRLRAIADETAEQEARLEQAWRALAAEARDGAFTRRWREVAARWNFYVVNDLIDAHNRNFPAESRLPMDPRTRDFVPFNGRHYRLEPLDAGWVLARLPPDRRAALG